MSYIAKVYTKDAYTAKAFTNKHLNDMALGEEIVTITSDDPEIINTGQALPIADVELWASDGEKITKGVKITRGDNGTYSTITLESGITLNNVTVKWVAYV